MNAFEQSRRLDNLLRLGVILEVDYANAKARVESGGIQTDFLPWVTLNAGKARFWLPPAIGDQVTIIAVSGELTTGIILPALFKNNVPNHSPDEMSIHFDDGAVLKYNYASGHFSLVGCKTAEIQAKESVSITSTTVTIHGNLNVEGQITSTGDTVAGGISLIKHKHKDVQRGKDETGQPKS